MTLTEILNEIKTQKGFQNADLEPQIIHGQVPGQEMARVAALAIAKRQSVERIEELRNIYDRTIYQNSAVILVTGSAAARKSLLAATADDDALAVESDAFFKRIAAAAEAQMSAQRVLTMNIGQVIVAGVAAGIAQFAASTFSQYPRFPGEYIDAVIRSSDEVLQAVKATAKPCTDIPLSITWLERNVAAMAYEQGFDSPPLAVVVSIEDPADLKSWESYFLPHSPSVTVNADDGSTEDVLATAKETLVTKMGT